MMLCTCLSSPFIRFVERGGSNQQRVSGPGSKSRESPGDNRRASWPGGKSSQQASSPAHTPGAACSSGGKERGVRRKGAKEDAAGAKRWSGVSSGMLYSCSTGGGYMTSRLVLFIEGLVDKTCVV